MNQKKVFEGPQYHEALELVGGQQKIKYKYLTNNNNNKLLAIFFKITISHSQIYPNLTSK